MRFQTVFRQRKNIMAVAILMILVYHMKGAMPEIALKKAAGYFYGAVDIFFFASGIGCFFSWNRNPDAAAFLKRRAARILPVYLPFAAVWIAAEAAGGGIRFPAALANFLGVHGFMEVTPAFNWYVSGMWLSYLLTPWLAAAAAGCDSRMKAAGAELALLAASVAFWGDTQLIIIAARMPVFFMGMLFAAESTRRESITKGEIAAVTAMMPAGALLLWETPKFFEDAVWSCGLAWYPMLLIVPGLCILLAAFFEWTGRSAPGRALNRCTGFLGGLTFEIYLVHFWALEKSVPVFLLLTAVCTAALKGVSAGIRRLAGKRG